VCFSTRPLPCKSHSEHTAEAMCVELENPDDEANSQVNKRSDDANDDCDDEHDDEHEDEADTDEVVSKLIPSRVSLAKRASESIYLTLRLHNLILTSM
jgi:hypothetical protein